MSAKPNLQTGEGAEQAPLPLDEAIELLESGEADLSIRVDFGHGYIGTASRAEDLPGLLQRARGLRLLKAMADEEPVERPAGLRSGMSVLHPLVEEILDALKQSG
ncbi:hypothetical protein [Henriciella aquimarina]|uniref:hypothetical protein n=1 Tax=Henriciella aquimarina TaxID=545261 RepID=UPI000A00B5A1|nr:hypothetical protein [Henriciella aquimarina]